ncbi:tetratricopeptide repeat protein [Mesorhizobium xinjiangense]|uniref:tetratricopeptide repeat protein n=1 Tax=Mesorhizobium xinjiangense TaxID=2678685 RepID=UPI0012ED0978|nr:tetratricopeptide repeat protein [Mesorhizobium xinjiangense]
MPHRFKRSHIVAGVVALALPWGFAAHAADGGGSSSGNQCSAGKVWDSSQQKCVPKSSELDTDSLFEAGRALAYAGRYDEAIDILKLAESRGDPRVLNMLGYANRMQGKLLVGLGYYEEALRIDPDHVLTREYLGEAHLQMGDLPAAREQLDEIAKRCGTGCEEYAELAGRIEAFETKGG